MTLLNASLAAQVAAQGPTQVAAQDLPVDKKATRETVNLYHHLQSLPVKGFLFGHQDAEIVRLVRNYRSSPQVVGLANAVITRAGAVGALQAQSAAGPEPSWLIAEDEAEESAEEKRIRLVSPAEEVHGQR